MWPGDKSIVLVSHVHQADLGFRQLEINPRDLDRFLDVGHGELGKVSDEHLLQFSLLRTVVCFG